MLNYQRIVRMIFELHLDWSQNSVITIRNRNPSKLQSWGTRCSWQTLTNQPRNQMLKHGETHSETIWRVQVGTSQESGPCYLSYPERLGGASPPRGVMELGFRVFGSREDLLEVFIVLGVLQDFCYIWLYTISIQCLYSTNFDIISAESCRYIHSTKIL